MARTAGETDIQRQLGRVLATHASTARFAARWQQRASNSPTVPSPWAAADRIVTDEAPLVPLVNPSTIDFVSSRVGNYQYDPQLGFLLDQLWVR